MKTILLLNVFKLTGDNIGDMREKNPSDRYLTTIMPDYCLRTDNHKITYSDGYLQWVDSGQEEYWLFNVAGCDEILKEEISQGGLEELLEDYDLTKIFNDVIYGTYEDFGRTIPSACHIVVELDYHRSYCHEFGTYEYEMYSYICGYLNQEMELIDVYGYKENKKPKPTEPNILAIPDNKR